VQPEVVRVTRLDGAPLIARRRPSSPPAPPEANDVVYAIRLSARGSGST